MSTFKEYGKIFKEQPLSGVWDIPPRWMSDPELVDGGGTLKEALQQQSGVPPDQLIIFAGKTLPDESTLEDGKVRPTSTLHMVLKLGGC